MASFSAVNVAVNVAVVVDIPLCVVIHFLFIASTSLAYLLLSTYCSHMREANFPFEQFSQRCRHPIDSGEQTRPLIASASQSPEMWSLSLLEWTGSRSWLLYSSSFFASWWSAFVRSSSSRMRWSWCSRPSTRSCFGSSISQIKAFFPVASAERHTFLSVRLFFFFSKNSDFLFSFWALARTRRFLGHCSRSRRHSVKFPPSQLRDSLRVGSLLSSTRIISQP